MSITKDKYYLLTFRAKCDDAFDLADIRLRQNTSDYAYGYVLSPMPSFTADWATYKILFQASATASDARIQFYFGGELSTTDPFYIDTLSLKECVPSGDQQFLFAYGTGPGNYGTGIVDVGNIIFNDGESCGVKRWVLADEGEEPYEIGLNNQGDFWYDTDSFNVKLYSTSNPASYYSDIEFEQKNGRGIKALGQSYLTIQNFDVRYAENGIEIGGNDYGFEAGSDCVTVRGCDVSFCGGALLVAPYERQGNGVMIVGNASNILFENNRVWDCYDTGIGNECRANTHVPPEPSYQENIIIRNNLFWNSEYQAYICCNQYVASNPASSINNVYFENNTCAFGGRGWSHDQRYGINEFGVGVWVAEKNATVNGVYIRNNIFYDCLTESIHALHTPCDTEDYEWMTVDYNLHYSTSGVLATIDGGSFTFDQFAEYQAESGYDMHSIFQEKPEFAAVPSTYCTASPSVNDFLLRAVSPSIDSGINLGSGVPKDFSGNNRPNGFGYDMGAYEYMYDTGIAIEDTDTTKVEGDTTALLLDYFEGTSLNETYWDDEDCIVDGSATVSDSFLYLNCPNSSSKAVVSSNDSFGYNTFTFEIGKDFTGSNDLFGLYGGGSQYILLRNDQASGDWYFHVSDGSNTYDSEEDENVDPFDDPVAGDVYTIVWTSSSVELLKNGDSVLTETTAVPTGTLPIFLDKYYGTGIATYGSIAVGYAPYKFTVSRAGVTTGETAVDYEVVGSGTNPAEAADFGGTLPSGSVTFAAGETTKYVVVYSSSDTTDEPDETFTLSLATTLFYEDFEGTSLDQNEWTPAYTGSANSSSMYVDDSLLCFDIPASSSAKITSNDSYGYNTFTFEIGADFTGYNDMFGLYGGGSQYILLRNDLGGGDWYFHVVDGSAPNYQSSALDDPVAGDVYTIVWTSSSVELLKNGESVLTETTAVPTGTLPLFIDKYGTGTAAYQSVSVAASPEAAFTCITGSGAGTILTDDIALSIAATDATKAEGNAPTLYDDFPGTSINEDNWDISGSPSVSDSLLHFTTPPGAVTSDDSWEYNTFTFEIGTDFTGYNDIFGLYSAGSGKHITIRNDGEDALWHLCVNDGVDTSYESAPLETPAVGDVYTVVWTPSFIELRKNGASLITETSEVPTGSMPVFLDKYAAGTAAYDLVTAGYVPFTFTVTRSEAAEATTVDYAITGSGGNPANASDFGGALPSGTVSFAAGETTKIITVYVSGDSTVELDEAFTVTLSNPSGNANITTATANGTIRNDDPTSLEIIALDASKIEDNTGTTAFTFSVIRAGVVTGATTVDYAVTGSGSNPANATDFGGTLPSGTVSFAADETSKTVTVYVSGDSMVETDEEFTVTLSNASGSAVIITSTATGTIQNDDDPLAIYAEDSVKEEGDSGDTAFTFTVVRTGLTTGTAMVDYTVTGSGVNPTDAADFGGTLPSGTLTFGDGETTKTLTVNVSGDTTGEPDETFTVTLSNASGGVPIIVPTATGTIIKDDTLLLGDANLDGTVNQTDSAIVSSNWLMLSGAGWGDGDFNGDQRVDDRDATVMAANFGRTVPPAIAASSAVATTEPEMQTQTKEQAVSYDLDNSGKVDLGDLAFFASVYGEKPGITTENPYAYAADFDRSGRVDLSDLALFAAKYQLDRSNSSFTQAAKVGVSSSAAPKPSLNMTGAPAPLPGDANLDGKVDNTDARTLVANWKTKNKAAWEDGDFNGDGLVNDADVAILARHWVRNVDGAKKETKIRDTVFATDLLLIEK